MYAWLWRHLPGPTPARIVLALTLLAGVVALCFLWLFPWLETTLNLDQVTVGSAIFHR